MELNPSEEIKARLDIIDVISEYVELKKAGANYKGLCPFHSEKTPSFMVSPDKQIFHCFGCGEGGDMFGFVMKHENITFPEALELLAVKAGVTLKKRPQRKVSSGAEVLYKLHEDATGFYRKEFDRSAKAKNYMKERGISPEMIDSFRVGYAPSGSAAVYKYLKGKGYDDRTIELSGIAKTSEDGRRFDMFRDRIVFPISDTRGRVIAFGARILGKGDTVKMAKYINSPETPIFRKGHTLFGFDVAREHIRKKGYAIISEGYTDVITFHQYGFRNVIAPLGTALTEDHIRHIRSSAKKLLLLFDGDEAGLRAARRSLPLIYANGMRAKVLLLPEGMDPDTFLREKGAQEMQKLFPGSKEVVDFYLDIDEDRVEIVRELLTLAAGVSDAILRGQIVTELAQKTSIPSVYLVEEIQKLMRPEKKESSEYGTGGSVLPEETLLAIAFKKKEFADDIMQRVAGQELAGGQAKDILEKMREMGSVPDLEKESINSMFTPEEVSYITALTIRTGLDEEMIPAIIDDCLKKIRARSVRKNIENMELRIRIAESSGDSSVLDALLIEKQAVLEEARNEGIL